MIAAASIELVLIFLSSSFGTMWIGLLILVRGLSGWRRGTYPLTESRDLSGIPAYLAAGLIILFGIIVIICGVATLVFCCFRLVQLLR